LVREAFLAAQVLAGATADFQHQPPAGAAAVTRALVSGVPIAAPDEMAALPPDALKRADLYRERQRQFRSGLTPPKGGSDEELRLYKSRVRVERVIVSLFDRKDAPKVAAGFALDVDFDREAPFIDELLRNLPVPWLAPYLNLIAGHRKLCAGATEDGRRQLARARDGGHPLIRVAALHLLDGVAFCPEQ
jgi:hypothetical protein